MLTLNDADGLSRHVPGDKTIRRVERIAKDIARSRSQERIVGPVSLEALQNDRRLRQRRSPQLGGSAGICSEVVRPPGAVPSGGAESISMDIAKEAAPINRQVDLILQTHVEEGRRFRQDIDASRRVLTEQNDRISKMEVHIADVDDRVNQWSNEDTETICSDDTPSDSAFVMFHHRGWPAWRISSIGERTWPSMRSKLPRR